MKISFANLSFWAKYLAKFVVRGGSSAALVGPARSHRSRAIPSISPMLGGAVVSSEFLI